MTRIILTETAQQAISKNYPQELEEGKYLRIEVQGGGCSGFSYNVRFDSLKTNFDEEFAFDNIILLIDKKSILYLEGSIIDYEDTMLHSGFKFINPNSENTCGCGISFDLK